MKKSLEKSVLICVAYVVFTLQLFYVTNTNAAQNEKLQLEIGAGKPTVSPNVATPKEEAVFNFKIGVIDSDTGKEVNPLNVKQCIYKLECPNGTITKTAPTMTIATDKHSATLTNTKLHPDIKQIAEYQTKGKFKSTLNVQVVFNDSSSLSNSFSIEIDVVGEEDKNVEKIFNQFVERAKLFGEIVEKGNPDDLAQMFKPYQHVPVITIIVTKNEVVNADNNMQDYVFYISYVSANQKFAWADFAEMGYFKDAKESESDDFEPVISCSSMYGRTIGGNIASTVYFNKERIPTKCNITCNAFPFLEAEPLLSTIQWDEKGKVILKKDWNIITETKVMEPPIPRALQEKFAKNKISNQTKTFFSFKPVTFPKINNKKIEAIFKRIEYLTNMKRPRDLTQLFNWELATKESRGQVQCFNGKVRDINFNTSVTGYNLSIDEDGTILAYAEGEIQYGETRNLENFYKKQEGQSRQYYWNMLNSFYMLDKGVEITFHPNGYPASYHTVISNRLYGRQIEWNDKGEIVSDVDLDIPKEWKDAPKENKSQSK
jgi:hypothetical protein